MKRLWPILIFALLGASRAMAQETISEGLTLKIPDQGARNWGQLFKDDFATPISAHDHSGGGKGVQLTASGFADYTFDDQKFRLRNNQTLKSRDAANSTNLDVIGLSNTDILRLYHTGAQTRTDLGLGSLATLSAIDDSLWSGTDLSVTNGGTGASTLTGYVKGSGTSALTASATIPSSDITGLGTMAAETATSYLTKAGNLASLADAPTARGNLGLGTMATQNSSNVSISGGSIAAAAVSGLGTMSAQNSNSVSISGGAMSGVTITGGSIPSSSVSGTFANTAITGLGDMSTQASNNVSISGGTVAGSTITQAVTTPSTTCSPACNAGYLSYVQYGKVIHVSVYLTTTGNPGATWTFTLPATPLDQAGTDYRGVGCWGNPAGTGVPTYLLLLGGSTTATAKLADNSSWPSGGTKYFGCEFSYLVN